jgi:hypothetical protein
MCSSSFSPTLADKVALPTEGRSAEDIAIALLRNIRPALYEQHPRAQLAKRANGSALRGLQRGAQSRPGGLSAVTCVTTDGKRGPRGAAFRVNLGAVVQSAAGKQCALG